MRVEWQYSKVLFILMFAISGAISCFDGGLTLMVDYFRIFSKFFIDGVGVLCHPERIGDNRYFNNY